MSKLRLDEHALLWKHKSVLRQIYTDFYQKIMASSVPGQTLEIGGGTGNLKEFLPQVIATDIIESPWLDCVCDAQSLPFKEGSMDNIVGIDILHHIEKPYYFFKEATRVLKPQGRIILLDPAITLVSYLFYKYFHDESVDGKVDPLEEGLVSKAKDPFSGNQAIPTVLFTKYLKTFQKKFPDLRIVDIKFISLWCYPLSGGFRPWSLIPSSWIKWILPLERLLEKYMGRSMGFRLYVVLEKSSPLP